MNFSYTTSSSYVRSGLVLSALRRTSLRYQLQLVYKSNRHDIAYLDEFSTDRDEGELVRKLSMVSTFNISFFPGCMVVPGENKGCVGFGRVGRVGRVRFWGRITGRRLLSVLDSTPVFSQHLTDNNGALIRRHRPSLPNADTPLCLYAAAHLLR